MTGRGGSGKGTGAPKAKAQSRGGNFVPLARRGLSQAERQRRLAQSRRDKAMGNGMSVSYQTVARARVGYKAPVHKGRQSGGAGGRLNRHIVMLRKSLPFSAPTRREAIHFRASFTLMTDLSPVFLFHPSRSTSAWVVTGREVDIKYADIERRIQGHVQGNAAPPNPEPVSSGSAVIQSDPSAPPVHASSTPQPGGDGNWSHWWVDGQLIRPESGTQSNLGAVNNTHPDQMVAQGIGVPHDLFSEGIRCLGGIASIQIQCGPTVRGFLHYRIVTGPELFAYSSAMIVGELSSPYFHRKALRPGVQTLHWHAPVENPAALELFGPHSSAFANLHNVDLIEPFSAIVYCFSNVTWAANDSAPMVTVSSCVNLQCSLPTGVRHLATKEPKTNKEELTKCYSESTAGEIAEGLGGIGGLAQAVEFGMDRVMPAIAGAIA